MGRDVIQILAKRFPQLYIAPAEGVHDWHRMAVGRGVILPNATLDHFITSDCDEFRVVETPAGPIDVVYLHERRDFETFLQIIGHKAQPVTISPTVGAISYFGLVDWKCVAYAREKYLASGGEDWSAEFARLAREPGMFRTQLIVLSSGPYSNVDASLTPYDQEEWLYISKEIRLYHECAHVVCRRTMPKLIEPIWDEITADMVGLLSATQNYDTNLAALFLGVGQKGYINGRLHEYVDEGRRSSIDTIAVDVYETIHWIKRKIDVDGGYHPFSILLDLKRQGSPKTLDNVSS